MVFSTSILIKLIFLKILLLEILCLILIIRGLFLHGVKAKQVLPINGLDQINSLLILSGLLIIILMLILTCLGFLLDHSPLILLVFHCVVSKSKVFGFDNHQLEYANCHRIIHDAWNFNPHSSPLHAFSHLIARTRSRLINWHTTSPDSLERDYGH